MHLLRIWCASFIVPSALYYFSTVFLYVLTLADIAPVYHKTLLYLSSFSLGIPLIFLIGVISATIASPPKGSKSYTDYMDYCKTATKNGFALVLNNTPGFVLALVNYLNGFKDVVLPTVDHAGEISHDYDIIIYYIILGLLLLQAVYSFSRSFIYLNSSKLWMIHGDDETFYKSFSSKVTKSRSISLFN